MKYPSSPLTPFFAALPEDSHPDLSDSSPISPMGCALTARDSITCSLSALFFHLPSFVFNGFQPLLPKHRGGGTRQQLRHSCHGSQPWLTELHNFGAPVNTFRINTCISVASKRLHLPLESTLMKKTTSSPFRINTYEKRGGGGPQPAGLKTAAT